MRIERCVASLLMLRSWLFSLLAVVMLFLEMGVCVGVPLELGPGPFAAIGRLLCLRFTQPASHNVVSVEM